MICRDLGWGSHDRMMRGLSARALIRWTALYAIEAQERQQAREKGGDG